MRGRVHVADMSRTKRIEHPAEGVQKGQECDVLVLDVDAENKRSSLGIKQLTDAPWPTISERLAPGVELEGHVVRVQEKGVVVNLGDDVEGLVPVSHSGIEDVEMLEEYYGPNDAVSLRVIESDAANRRIVLEVTDTPDRKPKEEIEAARAAAVAEAAAKVAAAGGPERGEGGEGGRKPRPHAPAPEEAADSEAASPPLAVDAKEVESEDAPEAEGQEAEGEKEK